MGKPKGKVKIEWFGNLAYAIGLIVTDGNLSSDGRHLSFTSKDYQLCETFNKALGINVPITKRTPGGYSRATCYRVQFGDVLFYRFLCAIGLSPNKSKRLEVITIPDIFFCDFLRGHFDGDGTFYSYWDPRWKSSFMYYLAFVSASSKHIVWLREQIAALIGAVSVDISLALIMTASHSFVMQNGKVFKSSKPCTDSLIVLV